MYLLYSLVPLIQVISAVHVIKTGRSYFWLWIILFFPLVGSIVYLVAEALPDVRRFSPGGKKPITGLLDLVQPARELKRLQEQLEFSPTVQNRRLLADYYLFHGRPFEAVDLYRECLRGVFEGDPGISYNLALALWSAEKNEEAKATIEALATRHPHFQTQERDLLYAKTIEELGQNDLAISLYEKMVGKYPGDEPRFRLACLLEKRGEKERAVALLNEIVKRSKRYSAYQMKTQREWLNKTKQALDRLRSLQPPPPLK